MPLACQPEWYRESRLFVPGRQAFFYYFGVKQNTVPAGTAKGLIDRPLETFSPSKELGDDSADANQKGEKSSYEEDDFR